MRHLCFGNIPHLLQYLIVFATVFFPSMATTNPLQKGSELRLHPRALSLESRLHRHNALGSHHIINGNNKRAFETRYMLGLWEITIKTSSILMPITTSADRLAEFFAGVATDATKYLTEGADGWIAFGFQARSMKLIFTCMHQGGSYSVPWPLVVELARLFEARARRGNPNVFTARLIGPQREWIEVALEIGTTILDSASEILWGGGH